MPGEISIAQVVLMGLITVFVGLICLIIIIKLMGTIIALLKQQSASPEKAEAATGCNPGSGRPHLRHRLRITSRLSPPLRSRSLRKWVQTSRISGSIRSAESEAGGKICI